MEKEVVILMSGGMDSYVAYHYAVKEKSYDPEEILALHFEIGQPYAHKEREAMETFDFPIKTINIDLIREEFDNVPSHEHGSQVIPGRNMIFATIAGSFGKRIWLTALKGERHQFMKDKSKKFYRDMTDLMTYVFSDSREETILETPFSHMTKSDVINWALDNGLTVDDLRDTSTCYHEEYDKCGICSTCVKRWIAFYNNDITEDYENPPYLSDYAKEYRQKLIEAKEKEDYSHYCKERIETDLPVLNEVLE